MANIVEDEVIKAEMQDGISQVDGNLTIEEFETAFDKETRRLRVYMGVKNRESGQTIEINNVWG